MAKSSSERLFEFEQIRELDEDLARSALTEPAAAEGVSWEVAAVELVVRKTSGYPYFLQQPGQDTWNLAACGDVHGRDAGSPSGVVAERVGKKVTSLGPVRASLISKGLIYAPEHGVVAYTVPGMAAFISRQPGEDRSSTPTPRPPIPSRRAAGSTVPSCPYGRRRARIPRSRSGGCAP